MDRRQPEPISVTNYCVYQARRYGDAPQTDCGYAIAAAFQHLITMGMLAPDPHYTNAGMYALTAKAKAIRSEHDYARYVHASRYPRGAIHSLIEKHCGGVHERRLRDLALAPMAALAAGLFLFKRETIRAQ